MDFPTEFIKRMQLLLGDKYPSFVGGYQLPLRRGVRVNQNKISTMNFKEAFPHPLTPSPFADNCFYLDEEHKAGGDPLHHAGAYYMQEPSASSAVSVLAPKPGERILDLCAAPGGKSTQIAAAIGKEGLLWSNEYVAGRARILQQNLERCAGRNVVVSNQDSAILCTGLEGFFDAVLVDAPCSGEGMFRKEPQALTEWSLDNILLCADRQNEILSNAAKAVRPGGRLVYSTCTFAPEENEGVVARFLINHPEFSIVPIDVPWGCSGFDAERVLAFCPEIDPSLDLTGCRRILPQHGGEGHFIASFIKKGDITSSCSPYAYPVKDANRAAAEELYAACFTDNPDGVLVTVGDQVRLLPHNLPNCHGLGVLGAGIAIATVCKNRLEPVHSAFITATKSQCRQSLDFTPDDPLLRAFLHGEEIPCDTNGWTTVCVAGVPVGFGKASNGRLKNRYPKGLRLL